MTRLKTGDIVRTLDGAWAIVEWIRPRQEIDGRDFPILIGNCVKLVGIDEIEYEWDLEWDGMFDDLPDVCVPAPNHSNAE